MAVISLGLGIGANAAIFSIYDALVLRPLPVALPSELAAFRSYHPLFGEGRYISYPLYSDLQSHLSSFSALIARSARQFNLNTEGNAQRVFGEFVSENYYDVLGILPAQGRLFTPADKFNNVAVLLYGCWQQRFGGDSHVIGKKIFIDAKPFVIIGVAAPDFRGTEVGSPLDIQIPASTVGVIVPGVDRLKEPRISWVEVIGRVRPNLSIDAANAEVQRIYPALKNPNIVGPDRLQLVPAARGVSPLRSLYSQQLVALLFVAGGVLILTCLNISSFLFARAFARRRESAILAALGAGRFEIAVQPVVESLLLSVLGAAVGFTVVLPLGHALIRFFPTQTTTESLGALIDWRVFFFGLVAAFLSSLIVSVCPALWAAFSPPAQLLKEGNTVTGRGTAALLGKALLAVQVLLSTVLVFGTTLFVRTAQSLEINSTGFSDSHLLLASLDPPSSGYNLIRTQQFYTELLNHIRALPGVVGAGLARLSPLSADVDSNSVCADDYHAAKDEKMEQNINTISGGYFSTVGISMLAGRDFNTHDVPESPRVAIINQKMAHDLFGSRSPIGHRIGIACDDPQQANIEVIGVVSDARYDSLRNSPARIAYISYLQNEENLRLTLNVRTASDVQQMTSEIRHAVGTIDPNVPLFDIRTVHDQIWQSLWREHLLARLSGFFSVLALVLCALGIYSVLSYSVQQRTKEIGVRLSLGASRRSVVFLVASGALWSSSIGLLVGIPLGAALVRLASALLYGVAPFDPGAILTTVIIILGCAIVAALPPASRIWTVNPVRVLRFE